jgi:deoxycytidine triphosphate deaminase
MQLCDKDILRAINNGSLVFAGTNPQYPFQREQVQPASVDLRLGNRFIRFKKSVNSFDIKNIKQIGDLLDVEYIEDGQEILINPGEILFGQIYEQMEIGDEFAARIEGRSRVARLGISVHCTGDYINPGFAGAMPLQIINHNHFPIMLYPYIGICQIIIYKLSDTPLVPYLQRSVLPYNAYYNETNPSPSILSANPTEGLTNETIIEKKIKTLIEGFYETQDKENAIRKAAGKPTGQIDEKHVQTVIQNATFQNLYSGGYIEQMRDQYNAKQAANQGPNAGQQSTVIQELFEGTGMDDSQLKKELLRVKDFLRQLPQDDDTDILIGEITKASRSLDQNKRSDALSVLKKCGRKLYDIAERIGCSLIATFLAGTLGLK